MRRAEFEPYRPKTILNKQKRADHWFWTRYTAYPYKGCQHGCEFCYCRETKYAPHDDPDDFAYLIKVKQNAPDLLRRALSRAPVDVIGVGDYQPLERKYKISRQMLEVCLELGFPVFVLERSPLVLRDLDLLQAINQRAAVIVVFSIIYTPDSIHANQLRRMERLAPPPAKRFAAMETLARAGIPVGTCMMPILPELCDDQANLRDVVRWTADHGGSFVMGAGLTLSDQQRDYFFQALAKGFPDLLPRYQQLYPPGSYGPKGIDWPQTGLRLKALCAEYGITDRIPRPVIPGEKRALNKRVAEALANQTYHMELHAEPQRRVWTYRKAAWAVEDTDQDLGLIYRQLGRKGLETIENVGPQLALVIESLIQQLTSLPEARGRTSL